MHRNVWTGCVLLAGLLLAASGWSGEAAQHTVLQVETPDTVRVRYHGAPMQVRLANVAYKGEAQQSEGLRYLRETLPAGQAITLDLEPETNGPDAPMAMGHLFAGATHINLELVRKGLARAEGRSPKYGAALTRAGDAPPASNGEAQFSAPPRREVPAVLVTSAPAPRTVPVQDLAPENYNGPVVAEMTGREYYFPASRYAVNIRAGARVEYASPAEAERAGKQPSPFSFPDRAKALAARENAGGGAAESIIAAAKKAQAEAQALMQEARKLARVNPKNASGSWKQAARLIAEHLDRVTPLADANPSDRELQRLSEEMSMSLYACNKYQNL